MSGLDRYVELVRSKELTDDEKRLKEAYRYRFFLDDVLCNRVKMLYEDELYVFKYVLNELEDRFDGVLYTTEEMREFSKRLAIGISTSDEYEMYCLSILRLRARQSAKYVMEGTDTIEDGIEMLWGDLGQIRKQAGRN